MKRILLPLAAILVSGPLFSQDVFEVHGYARAGAGRSSNGGEQVSFYLPNTGDSPTAGPGYRLGNETDNYLELAMDVRAYDKGKTSFKLHFRPTFRQYYGARDASEDAGGQVDGSTLATGNQMVYLRETWGEATGVFGRNNAFEDATAWIGRRFYQRQDLHLRDQWFWNDSGDGVGIENINVGVGKLHYAYIQHDKNNVDGNGVHPLSNWGEMPTGLVVASHDLRLSDLNPWKGASVTLGMQYNVVSSRAQVQNPNTAWTWSNTAAGVTTNPTNSGFQVSGLWSQSNVVGGDNKVFATYGNGNTFYNFYNPEINTHNKWWHVMEMYYLKPVAKLEMQGVVQYRRQIQGGQSDATGWNHQDWFSAGVRPVYFFTQHVSLAGEVGYDQLRFSNEPTHRFLVKKTLALQVSPQASYWSRPVLRLFVTNANWNVLANSWGAVDAGQFSTQGANSSNVYSGKTSGTTYGAQIEAWW